MSNATPMILPCPACQQPLKLNRKIEPGKKLKCNGCGHEFRATEEMLQEAKPANTTSAKPSAKPAPTPEPSTASSNNSLVTAIYVGCGVILLAAVIFSLPSILGGNKPAENQPQTSQNKNSGGNDNQSHSKSPNDNNTGDNSSDNKKGPESKKQPANVKTKKKENPIEQNPSTGTKDDNGSPEKKTQTEPPKDDDPNRPKNTGDVKNKLAKNNAEDEFDPNAPQDKDPVVNDLQEVEPVGGVQGLKDFVNQAPLRSRFARRPLIIVRNIPILIPRRSGSGPSKSGSSAGKKKGKGSPVVSVQIQAVNTTITPSVVDRLASPGHSGTVGVNLSGTPTSPITVTVKPPAGIVADKTTLSFAASVAPTQQTIRLSGDGTAALGLTNSRLTFVDFDASGTGLSSSGTIKFPVNLVRRNRYILINSSGAAITFVRADLLGGPTRNVWIVFDVTGTPFIAGTAPTNPALYYTENHVELIVPGTTPPVRIRFTNNQLLAETAAGSGTYAELFPGTVGTWQ